MKMDLQLNSLLEEEVKMDTYRMIYIDDTIDPTLDSFLDQYRPKEADVNLEFSDVPFEPNEGYEFLLNSPKVREANIILIDDCLFENPTVTNGKITGEEFKVVLRKYFPFIETIVITQNKADPETGTISKYNAQTSGYSSAFEYYCNTLPDIIEEAIQQIKFYRQLGKKLEDNPNWEPVLREKIINSLQGLDEYHELTKDDIDELISAFKEIQVQLNE